MDVLSLARIACPAPARLPCALAAVASLMGCTTPPELTAQIEDAQMVLADTNQVLEPRLAALAVQELQAAEAAAAQRGDLMIDLTGDCVLASIDLAIDVSDCMVVSNVVPDEGPLNATQTRNAFAALVSYFAVLHDLTTTQAPADIRMQGDAVVAALQEFNANARSDTLDRLAADAARYGPATAAGLGFLAEQARVAALRRTLRRADPVIEELVRGMQPLLQELGDPIADRRQAVTDTYFAVTEATASNNADALLQATAQLREAVSAMREAEAASLVRRLYLLRDLNAAMLDRLSRRPSLTELEQITGQIAEIAVLLEQG